MTTATPAPSAGLRSALYEGWVRHRRYAPREHAFEYKIFQAYLDLSELDHAFDQSVFWSGREPAIAWFDRRDHLPGPADDPERALDECVRDLVERRTGHRPAGPVRLLTSLRMFGYCFNPVSFYYVFDGADEALEFIVAEVHNTPWNEQHCYVLDRRCRDASEAHGFDKRFHVSPFMAMEQRYRWRLGEPGERLTVHMENFEEGERLFDATMVLHRAPITARSLRSVLVRYPFMTARVIAAIYYQAARLWLKRVPYHHHPADRARETA